MLNTDEVLIEAFCALIHCQKRPFPLGHSTCQQGTKGATAQHFGGLIGGLHLPTPRHKHCLTTLKVAHLIHLQLLLAYLTKPSNG